jgi:hypothetical protein
VDFNRIDDGRGQQMCVNYTNAAGEGVFPSDEAVEAASTAGALDMSYGARRFVSPMSARR